MTTTPQDKTEMAFLIPRILNIIMGLVKNLKSKNVLFISIIRKRNKCGDKTLDPLAVDKSLFLLGFQAETLQLVEHGRFGHADRKDHLASADSK